ncbi:hypothetical protein pb186bvf_005873 [Paramecium bursaria]
MQVEEEKQPANAKIFEEDDDEFEEFESDDLLKTEEHKKIDIKQWREDWDDEDLNDEFTQQIR